MAGDFHMQQMPLSRRVIFSDWHGVLSRDPFWVSIRNSATHPLHDQLEASMAALFRNEVTANEWMKGLLSSADVIKEMGIQLHGQFLNDFLARRLDLDCARMTVNVDLFEVLRLMRTDAVVVIATDNMDCFVRAFENARMRRKRPRLPLGGTLADWAKICDDIICSSQNGALKSEDPQAFFGPWLDRHGLTFTEAVLLDDREDNCAAFTAHGGTAIRWKMGTNDTAEARDKLAQWLDSLDQQRMKNTGTALAPAVAG
jgi:hypothetical protein